MKLSGKKKSSKPKNFYVNFKDNLFKPRFSLFNTFGPLIILNLFFHVWSDDSPSANLSIPKDYNEVKFPFRNFLPDHIPGNMIYIDLYNSDNKLIISKAILKTDPNTKARIFIPRSFNESLLQLSRETDDGGWKALPAGSNNITKDIEKEGNHDYEVHF